MSDDREYMRKYMAKRYHDRRTMALEKLGNKCNLCGAIENLQIDHTIREEKSFSVARKWNIAIESLILELDKCQLLCQPCHNKKTTAELGRTLARGTHGTHSAYRYCKCDICKEFKREYMRKYRRLKKQQAFVD